MSSGALRLRRTRNASELLAITEPLEPHATMLVGRLRDRTVGREDRAFLVEDVGESPLGVVLVTRLCFDRWYAKPLLLDDRAAPLVARAVDRSRARGLFGPEEHVGPLVPFLSRAGRVRTMPWAWVPPPLPPPESALDPRTRLATRADFGALVDLYRTFDLDPVPPRRVAGVLARVLDRHMIVVAEEQGRLVAAMRAETRSRRYLYWGGLTVRPESRNRSLARAVILRTHAVSRDCGLGYMVVRATARPPAAGRRTTFNPLLQRPDYRALGASGTWSVVSLRPHPARRALTRLPRRLERQVRARPRTSWPPSEVLG